MGQLVDPYSNIESSGCRKTFVFSSIGYLDRYRNMKILQLQSSGDEFFLPDNEVRR